MVKIESTHITQATVSAWDMIPTFGPRLQHFTCLLPYHANQSTTCNTVDPGYRGNHGLLPANILAGDVFPTLVTRVHHLWFPPHKFSWPVFC